MSKKKDCTSILGHSYQGRRGPRKTCNYCGSRKAKEANVYELIIRKAIDRLKKETRHMSASHIIRQNPAWAELVSYGLPTIKVFLTDLLVGKYDWNYFGIACEIANDSPVIPEDELARIAPVTKRYIEWMHQILTGETQHGGSQT